MKTPISFRLRKDVDADLIAALSETEQNKIAELCRNGLRMMLGIQTTRQVQIVERQLIPVKSVSAKIGSKQLQGKPIFPGGMAK